ncbi:hypothetical protein [Leifsonia soli]|uniref:Ca2+/H+ antiporter n=1 Tax=Leifsonia soli TaxID=582665 RepID=A0A852T5A9_9MICO|nr:hypothetical protein [Leifsonia soli]NYD76051.1 Ca2+/H+ antiporter [Leifsonia soli]
MSRENTGITIGSVGFAVAVALTLIGAFTRTDLTLIVGAAVAAVTVMTCVILQFTSRKER